MDINIFSGIAPRIPAVRAKLGVAKIAHDIDLSMGTLAPLRRNSYIQDAVKNARAIATLGCDIYTWDTCVTTTEWIPDCPRLYITGRKDYPEVAVHDRCSGQLVYGRLGVPSGGEQPLLSYMTVVDKSEETANTSYVYTYVNWLGEEGGPSFPSSIISVNDGQPVVVSGWEEQPEEYGVTHVRIYRSVTAFRSGEEKAQTFSTNYQLVDTIPVTEASYKDELRAKYLGEVLWTKDCREPPAGLQGIITISDSNMLCGFVGNKLYFSNNREPWNWPESTEITLDYNIVHIGEQEGYLYVSTNGYPYRVAVGEFCQDNTCKQVDRYDTPLPDIGCAYPNGSIVTPFGMVYSSPEGLVLLSRNAQPIILTEELLNRAQWETVMPSTVRFGYTKGYLIFVTDQMDSEGLGCMLLLNRDLYPSNSPTYVLTTISDTPIAMCTTNTGELLMLRKDKVYRWASSDELREYHWESLEIYGKGLYSLAAARLGITSGMVEFCLESRGGSSCSKITNDTAFRIARMGQQPYYTISISGTGVVEYAKIGTSKRTL